MPNAEELSKCAHFVFPGEYISDTAPPDGFKGLDVYDASERIRIWKIRNKEPLTHTQNTHTQHTHTQNKGKSLKSKKTASLFIASDMCAHILASPYIYTRAEDTCPDLCVASAGVCVKMPYAPHKIDIVNPNQPRYLPQEGDVLVGQVISKSAEFFRLDINSFSDGLLPLTGFFLATKRSYPKLDAGVCVLCAVSRCRRGGETDLTCVSNLDTKDWLSGENYLGPLSPQVSWTLLVPVGHAKLLLADKCFLFDKMGEHKLKYEVAVGLNGRVWVKGEDIWTTIIVTNAIKNSIGCTIEEIDEMLKRLVSVKHMRD